MHFTLRYFHQTTQNNAHFTHRKAHKCIALWKALCFDIAKKQIISQIRDVYFSLIICIVYN